MAAYVKFQQFIEDFGNKVHDLVGTSGSTADVLRVYLTNTAPNVATNAVKADLAEIATGNGYAGPISVSNVGSETTGTLTVTGTGTTVTAAGGSIGPFRYVVLYNDTPTSPADPLIAYWDNGSSVTLLDTQQFTITFGANLFTHV